MYLLFFALSWKPQKRDNSNYARFIKQREQNYFCFGSMKISNRNQLSDNNLIFSFILTPTLILQYRVEIETIIYSRDFITSQRNNYYENGVVNVSAIQCVLELHSRKYEEETLKVFKNTVSQKLCLPEDFINRLCRSVKLHLFTFILRNVTVVQIHFYYFING